MSKITLKFTGGNRNRYSFFINNKRVKLKKNKFGHYEGSVETDEKTAVIEISTLPNELSGKNWFWRYMLYFIVSIFGIFDSNYSGNGYYFSYKETFPVNGDIVLNISTNKAVENGDAIIEKNGILKGNETNKYHFDSTIKTRVKIARGIKYGSWVLIAIGIILAIVLKGV